MEAFAAILRKDLRLELRAGEAVLTLIGISLLILVAIVFALDPAVGRRDPDAAAGALWIALIFSGTIGGTRALLGERENGCLNALLLSPLDRATIFAAKLAASFIFMAIAESAGALALVLFFNLDFDARLASLAPSLIMGALGFSALTTLLAAISGRVRAGDLLLPLLAVPLFAPALIAGVKASSAALSGADFSASSQWLQILAAFDILFIAAGYLLFEYVIGED